MEIIYFYPERERQGRVCTAKKHWFQEASLRTHDAGACGEEMHLTGCAVPVYYYKRRPWRPQELSEAMERTLHISAEIADTFLHPQIEEMLTDAYAGRWSPRGGTVERLAGRLTEAYAADIIGRCGETVVLLGAAEDMERQLELTWELLRPCLVKINRMLIFYEELAETDIWSELSSHLDEYYYEYGLVPQLEPYAETMDGFRCGKPRCCGLILDYCAQFRYPKIMPGSEAVYIDMASAADKESALHRKTPQIPYVSPLKYLDTMVKNSYDRLVN